MINLDDFDQQTTILLQKSKGPPGGSQTLHFSSLNATASYDFNNLSSKITTIEEKLNQLDSIYRLASQANTENEKEKQNQLQQFINSAKKIDQTISQFENQTESLDKMIKEMVHTQIQEFNKSQETKDTLTTATKQLNERLDSIEKHFVETSKKSQKEMKKLKYESQISQTQHEDDGRVDEIVAQLTEMKRQQNMMFDVLGALQSKVNPNFHALNSQLNQLWSQFATQRTESSTK